MRLPFVCRIVLGEWGFSCYLRFLFRRQLLQPSAEIFSSSVISDFPFMDILMAEDAT